MNYLSNRAFVCFHDNKIMTLLYHNYIISTIFLKDIVDIIYDIILRKQYTVEWITPA